MPLLVSSHGEVPARAEGISSLGRCPQGRRGTFYITRIYLPSLRLRQTVHFTVYTGGARHSDSDRSNEAESRNAP